MVLIKKIRIRTSLLYDFFSLLVIIYSLNKICRNVSYTNYHSSFVYQPMLFISQHHSWPYHCL